MSQVNETSGRKSSDAWSITVMMDIIIKRFFLWKIGIASLLKAWHVSRRHLVQVLRFHS